MSTMRIKCLSMREVESVIADAQEILSHVEFGSLKNGVLNIILCGLSLKIRSQYDNCRACATEQSLTNFRIMTARQIIYSSTIIVLGFFQALPALLCLASTNIPVILLGIIWGVLLGKFWSSTIIGKWYFRELWRATLRLENLMFPEV